MHNKIAIYSFSFGEASDFKDAITSPFKSAYSRIHGYDYILVKPPDCDEPRPTWKKIEWAIKLLPHYEYLMWMDTDAAIVNFRKRIEDFIPPHIPPYDLIIQQDVMNLGYHDRYFNAGIFIIRNSNWTFKMLKEWEQRGKSRDRSASLQDQPVLNDMYAKNINDMQKHTFIHPKDHMQSVNYKHYKKGMFIKHCAGMGKSLNHFEYQFYKNLDKGSYKNFGITWQEKDEWQKFREDEERKKK